MKSSKLGALTVGVTLMVVGLIGVEGRTFVRSPVVNAGSPDAESIQSGSALDTEQVQVKNANRPDYNRKTTTTTATPPSGDVNTQSVENDANRPDYNQKSTTTTPAPNNIIKSQSNSQPENDANRPDYNQKSTTTTPPPSNIIKSQSNSEPENDANRPDYNHKSTTTTPAPSNIIKNANRPDYNQKSTTTTPSPTTSQQGKIDDKNDYLSDNKSDGTIQFPTPEPPPTRATSTPRTEHIDVKETNGSNSEPSTTTASPRDVIKETPEEVDVRLITEPMLKLALYFSGCQGSNDCTSNSVFSPLSIASILTLLMAGSNGETYRQLKSLNYPSNSSDLHIDSAYKNLMQRIDRLGRDGPSGVQLNVANAIFPITPPLDDFVNKAEQFYSSKLIRLDGAASGWKDLINDWVSNKTNDRIKNVIDDLSPRTVMVVANAIYFKGDWADQFDDLSTYNGSFTVTSSEILQNVPIMEGIRSILYADDDRLGCQIIALPYEGNQVSMYMILPTGDQGIDSLNQLQSKLTAHVVQDLMNKMDKTIVSVKIPKFRIDQTLDLKKPLQSAGVVDMFFDGKANLTRLTVIPDAYVTKMVHKSFIEVDEKGTEAAGATVVTLAIRVKPPTVSKTFQATHPFLYLIVDASNGAVYFAGRLVRPSTAARN